METCYLDGIALGAALYLVYVLLCSSVDSLSVDLYIIKCIAAKGVAHAFGSILDSYCLGVACKSDTC